MEILPYQQPSQPVANVTSLIQAVVVSAADLALIKATNTRLETIAKVSGTAQPSNQARPGQWRGHWHLEADKAGEELGLNPSIEAAEKFHRLLMRAKEATETAHLVSATCAEASRRESMTLADVAGRIIDAAEAKLEDEAEVARINLRQASAGMFENTGLASLENQVAAMRAGLTAERATAADNPAWWLYSNGIGVVLPEPLPAPKPLAPVKNPARGKVELSDVAAEMAADLH
jgi:hypothetical protein